MERKGWKGSKLRPRNDRWEETIPFYILDAIHRIIRVIPSRFLVIKTTYLEVALLPLPRRFEVPLRSARRIMKAWVRWRRATCDRHFRFEGVLTALVDRSIDRSIKQCNVNVPLFKSAEGSFDTLEDPYTSVWTHCVCVVCKMRNLPPGTVQ